MPTPPCSHLSRCRAALVVLAVSLLALTGPVGLAGASSQVLPTDRAGADVVVTPAVIRAPAGAAEVDIEVGTTAPDDVVVVARLVLPVVAADGTVTVGTDPAPGSVTAGSRLRPGERLRVTVAGLEVPTLAVATVTSPDGASLGEPAALLLPGAVGPPPTVTVATAGDLLEATVTTTAPTLVSVRLVGATTTVLPERLVLPDAPLRLSAAAPRWILPAEVAVTDEAGRTVTARTSTAGLAGLAVTLLITAAGALVIVRRRHRARAVGPAATAPDHVTAG